MSCLSNIGKDTNNANEGITSQNIPIESSLILLMSFVSWYSHIIAKTETKGTEAKIAPINELRLLTSEIATMRTVVIMIFIR